jgi:hypothetical protein
MKKKAESEDKEEKNLYRDDLKERVSKLEQLLTDSAAGKG